MRFTNLTRATEIGANSYLLEIGGRRVALDCGMHPKLEGDAATPNVRLVADGSLDAILISHSHLDHIGSLPVLMRRQPQARVFMSAPTARLGEALLHNSVNVMSKPNGGGNGGQGHAAGGNLLFTHRETDAYSQNWQECSLRQWWSLEGERLSRPEEADVSFELFDAGHILGSTGILLRGEGKTVFYTGDVNFLDQTVSRAAAFPEEKVDVLIVETTRGDNPTAANFLRADEELRLVKSLGEAFARGGAVLIPVFALGKTQEVLAMLMQYKQRGVLGEAPIYIGGLSTKITEIYDRFASSVPRRLPGLSLLNTMAPYVLAGREASASPIKSGRIYALSSGMMTEKTLSNVFARRMLADPKHSILFVGYADPESPAGKLRAARPGDLVQLDSEAPPVERRCHVEAFDFSAHSNRDDIRKYVCRLAPKKVILVHGDPAALGWFQKSISADLPETEVMIPPPGVPLEL
jgi:Cft2 family RNA processing exonuclease